MEEYFLDRNIGAEDVISFCATILTKSKHPLFESVIRMFRDIPDTRALSCSRSSGWKFDAFLRCRELKILERIISILDHPSDKIIKHCLASIDVFLLCAIDHEVASNGFSTFFALGNPEVEIVRSASSKIVSVKRKKCRNPGIRQPCSKILLRLSGRVAGGKD